MNASTQSIVDAALQAKRAALEAERDLIDIAIASLTALQALHRSGSGEDQSSLAHRQEPSGASERIDASAGPDSPDRLSEARS